MGKLTATKVTALLRTLDKQNHSESDGKLVKAAKHSDGDGLFLVVKPNGASWIAKLQAKGRRREYGLGSAKLVSLSEARERCRTYKRELLDGRDPLILKRVPPVMTMTFREAVKNFLDKEYPEEKRRKRPERNLELHALPKLGRMQIQSIDADLIADTLRPIWTRKPEAGRKVLSLIIRTLKFVRPHGTSPDSEAISLRLSKQPPKGNMAAIEYCDVPAFMRRVEEKSGIGALALRFAILCASRGQEVRGAQWAEFDLEDRLWSIPAARMKMGKVHKVPLSDQAIVVLEQAQAYRRHGCDLVFPSSRDKKWISDMTMVKVIRDLGEPKATQHGFRSSFRTWLAETQTSVREEVAEWCLAHGPENGIIASYRRATYLDERRDIMAAWGRYCAGGDSAEIVRLEPRRA